MAEPVGCAAVPLAGGGSYVVIHYTADEGKRYEEKERLRRRADMGRDKWDREMELDERIYDGDPVYKDYIDDIHCPPAFRSSGRDIPIVQGSVYIGGWDCGQSLQPAFVLLQITPRPFQVHVLLEVCATAGVDMEKFAPVVMQRLVDWHPALWADVDHYGDPTVETRSGTDGRNARQVARKHGFNIKPSTNQLQVRRSAVTWLLTDMIDEDTPRLFVSGKNCPILREGFLGAYQNQISPTGDSQGPGMELRVPKKNSFSHVHDAMQYAAIQVRKELTARNAKTTSRR